MIPKTPKSLCVAFLDTLPDTHLERTEEVRELVHFLPLALPVTHADNNEIHTCWEHKFQRIEINIAKLSKKRDGTPIDGSFSLVFDPESMSKSQAIDAITNAFYDNLSQSLDTKRV